MSMPEIAKRWTRDAVLALPDDGNRYELLDGELLVSPSPTGIHQRAVLLLYDSIGPYVKRYRLGWTGLSPADLDFRSGQLLQPDLFVAGLVDGREPLRWEDFEIPLLVAEVLSPSTALYDRNRKRPKFQAAGVGEYWIVDTDGRVVERWKPADERPEILTETLAWQPRPDLPALEIGLAELFKEVWGE